MPFYKNPARNAGQGYSDPNEQYWADEENQLRGRGIDPMQVDQVVPPKLPNAPGSSALHAKGGMVGDSPMMPVTRTDHVNKSYKMAGGGFIPSFVGAAAQSFGSKFDKKNKTPGVAGSAAPTAAGVPASSINDTDDYDTN
jgi:hypothetical protein